MMTIPRTYYATCHGLEGYLVTHDTVVVFVDHDGHSTSLEADDLAAMVVYGALPPVEASQVLAVFQQHTLPVCAQ